jgi:hypothetical protein
MKCRLLVAKTFFFWCMIFAGMLASGQTLDQIGLTLLRDMTTNLNGTGISVAQPEGTLTADYKTWEVNPANVGQSASLFSYASSNGTASLYPNTVGTNSWHAEDVGDNFYGMPNGVATNLAHVGIFEADYFLTTYIEFSHPPSLNAAVVNQSFTFGPLSVASQRQIDSYYDNAAVQNKILFVSAADNYGTSPPNSTNVCAPGTAYNCICVGAYGSDTYFNSIGPTPDNGRCKPDLTAPNGETSFSTPFVSGAAALLMQAALRGDGGNNTNAAVDMRTLKALLLNGAVKPANWTNSSLSPLDARYGAGVLNVFNAYEQFASGKHSYIASTTFATGGAHPPSGVTGTVSVMSGWDFNTNTSGSLPSAYDAVNHYYFNATNSAKTASFTATATLVWNRQQDQSAINNLNLFLFNCANSNLVACSTSLVDNVEHIFVPNLPSGRYDLQVWKAGGPGIVSAAEPYALAWEFFSDTLVIGESGTNTVLLWPAYPAGMIVEMATNLNSPVWSTNNLPTPVIMQSFNALILNATNTNSFFRLHAPNL